MLRDTSGARTIVVRDLHHGIRANQAIANLPSISGVSRQRPGKIQVTSSCIRRLPNGSTDHVTNTGRAAHGEGLFDNLAILFYTEHGSIY
jgi:hypothetical protein